MANVRLTTIDNPYDPFTQWDLWYAYDTVQMGYYTSEYLARVTPWTEDMAPDVADALLEDTIDEICELNLLGKYKKVTREDTTPPPD